MQFILVIFGNNFYCTCPFYFNKLHNEPQLQLSNTDFCVKGTQSIEHLNFIKQYFLPLSVDFPGTSDVASISGKCVALSVVPFCGDTIVLFDVELSWVVHVLS